MTPREAMKKRVWLFSRGWYDFFYSVENGYIQAWRYDGDQSRFLTFTKTWIASDDMLDYDGYEQKDPPQRDVIVALFRTLA
jgi:hypothetical protein